MAPLPGPRLAGVDGESRPEIARSEAGDPLSWRRICSLIFELEAPEGSPVAGEVKLTLSPQLERPSDGPSSTGPRLRRLSSDDWEVPKRSSYGPSGSGRASTRSVGCSPDKPMLSISQSTLIMQSSSRRPSCKPEPMLP